MVGHHVPERPRQVVVAAALLDPHRLRHRDLHVVDVAAVPDRLEDPVREPEDHHVLDGLLAQVVVDPVDLALLEGLVHRLRQVAPRMGGDDGGRTRLPREPRESGISGLARGALETGIADVERGDLLEVKFDAETARQRTDVLGVCARDHGRFDESDLGGAASAAVLRLRPGWRHGRPRRPRPERTPAAHRPAPAQAERVRHGATTTSPG